VGWPLLELFSFSCEKPYQTFVMHTSQKKNSIFSALLLLSLAVFVSLRCSVKEFEMVPPYQQIEDDFDQIGDLPNVEDPDPEIKSPNYDGIDTPELLNNLLREIGLFADDGISISAAGKSELKNIHQALKSNSIEMSSLGQLDEVFLKSMANPDNELSELDEEILAKLDQLLIELGFDKFFPEILDVEDLPTQESILALIEKDSRSLSGNNLRLSELYLECLEEANRAFQRRLRSLNDQLISAEDEINENYLRRANEAEERLMDRNELVHYLLMQQMIVFNEMIEKVIRASFRATKQGDEELAEDLLAFALVYAYYVRSHMSNWVLGSLAFNYQFYKMEIEMITKIRNERLEAVKKHYREALELAEKILREAKDKYCHNQGSGH
jgi:hypothetical protein